MSNLEFNETDFPEYDPTPYDGGYDINTTYGKPLPPSEKICYPRAGSNKKLSSPPAKALIDDKPTQKIESLPPFADNNLSKKPDFDTPIEPNSGKESPQYGNGYVPNGYDYSSEEIGDYDYEREENGYTLGQVPLPPSEYVEPCASLFGYWPCLVKDYREKALQQCCKDKGYGNGWRKAEDYFFGSSYPFGGTRDDYVNRVDYNYGYEKHYVEQPTYVQEHYNPHSQKMSSHVDVNYGYEKHYMEQPTHVQEHYNPDSQKLSTHVDINYGYEKHYMEQATYVQEKYKSQLSKQVEDNYVYDKHYMEQPSYVQEDLWPEKLSNHVDADYGYDKYYTRNPTYVEGDYVPDLESQNMYSQVDFFQGYDKHYVEQTIHVSDQDCNLQFHPQKLCSQEDSNYGYERSYKDQPSYVQDDYSPQLWSQKLSYSYYEA